MFLGIFLLVVFCFSILALIGCILQHKKEGIKLYFDVDTEDQETAAIVAKKAIKADPMSGTLIISVKVEK